MGRGRKVMVRRDERPGGCNRHRFRVSVRRLVLNQGSIPFFATSPGRHYR